MMTTSNKLYLHPEEIKDGIYRPKVQLVLEIIDRLRQTYPEAGCELDYSTPYELLVATILSAQCTDEQVNEVTPKLFAAYPTPYACVQAPRLELEILIRPTGFYRQKAKFIQETSRILVDKYRGHVPDNMQELTQLPGVARKTANVVLGECFDVAEGITVDTHVSRLANRLGLSNGKNAIKVENDLMKIVPQEEWIAVSYLLLFHGRGLCTARKPACTECPLQDICPSAGLG
ncbi:MAG: endonuclease III [Anaerolineales bacterium]|nr:endonuclease III [Anaerolineales bacterium]